MIKIGDRFRCSEPLEVRVLLAVGAPVSLFGEGTLPANEVIIVTNPDVYGKVCCRPENYDALHDHFVTQEERDKVNRDYFNTYEGYELLIPADVILTCERLESDSTSE